MSLNLATLLHEATKQFPKRTAIVLGETTIDYATLDHMARRFAGGLQGLGLRPGQHIALLLPNVPHFTIAYFGGHYAANPIVPLNVLLTADEIAYHLEDSDAVALIAWEGFAPQAQAAVSRVPSCKHLIIARADRSDVTAPEGALSFTMLVATSQPVIDVPATMPDDTAVILYTSGTTGKAKGAELTHFNMFFNAHYVRTMLLRFTENDVTFGALPLFHSFGQTVIQNATLASGGAMVLLPRFDPESAFGLIQKHHITIFAGVPTMYFAMLHFPRASEFKTDSLRAAASGGSAMPVEVLNAFDAKFNLNVLEGYGLSETSPVASFNQMDRPKKVGSIGLPIWGVEFKLVDEAGNTISDALVPGEIAVRGHNIMRGYYQRPEATAEAIKDGWFYTGDVGHRDEEGYYFIVDRKKDMIIRGGFNVYPREIEEVLYGHPCVAECAVIGVPNASHGEEVKAIIAKKPGFESVTAEDIIAYAREKLAAYKYPRVVVFMDALPKGPTGKILKRALRD